MGSKASTSGERARLKGLVDHACWDTMNSGRLVTGVSLSGYWISALAKECIYGGDGSIEMNTPAGLLPVHKRRLPGGTGFRLEYERGETI